MRVCVYVCVSVPVRHLFFFLLLHTCMCARNINFRYDDTDGVSPRLMRTALAWAEGGGRGEEALDSCSGRDVVR